MIQSVRFENFRCLREVELTLVNWIWVWITVAPCGIPRSVNLIPTV
jgi:AAA15 family ATPase/GTPase